MWLYSSVNHVFIIILFILYPVWIVGDSSCSANVFSNDNNYNFVKRYKQLMLYQDIPSNDVANSRILHGNLKEKYFITLSVPSKTIHQLDGLFVPRFVYNHNVLLFDFVIPPDTTEYFFSFIANEFHASGGACKSKKIELILNPNGIPITNITFPENFVTNDDQYISYFFESNGTQNDIIVTNPVPGYWFARVFQTWTDPNEDILQADGFSSQCQTLMAGRVGVNLLYDVTIVSCDSTIEVELQATEGVRTDHYKCWITSEVPSLSVPLSISTSQQNIKSVIIKLQGKRLNDNSKKSQFECVLDLQQNQINEVLLKFSPYVSEWHYIEITYGENPTTIQSNNLEKCEAVQNIASNTFNKIDLVRFSGFQLFMFEYLLPNMNKMVTLTSNQIKTLKFNIFPTKDIGGTLSLEISVNNTVNVDQIIACIGIDRISSPTFNGSCQHDSMTKSPDLVIKDSDYDIKALHYAYPETGNWFITFGTLCKNMSSDIPCNATISATIVSSACFKNGCGRFGSCQILQSANLVYSACRCFGGYTGWLCTDDAHIQSQTESLLSILLLTLSNLFFIPSVIFAIRRKYYTEALVYCFTIFFSSFYHACDASSIYYGLCIMDFGVLQYSDFFCAILSIWVTLVAMTSLNKTLVSLLHIFGAILIAFGTEWNRFSMFLFIAPCAAGGLLVIAAWIYFFWKTRKLFPGKIYLFVFFPAGLLAAVVGLVCFGLLQTNKNYHIVHSIWHVTVALSVLLLLPIKKFFYTDEYIDMMTESPFNTILQTTLGK